MVSLKYPEMTASSVFQRAKSFLFSLWLNMMMTEGTDIAAEMREMTQHNGGINKGGEN